LGNTALNEYSIHRSKILDKNFCSETMHTVCV